MSAFAKAATAITSAGYGGGAGSLCSTSSRVTSPAATKKSTFVSPSTCASRRRISTLGSRVLPDSICEMFGLVVPAASASRTAVIPIASRRVRTSVPSPTSSMHGS